MILSDYNRRWAEVRFYSFCADMYKYRKKTIDIINTIENICTIGGIDYKSLKAITGRMLNDPYYRPNREDTTVLAHLNGIKTKDIAEYHGKTKQAINEYLRKHSDYYPSPLLTTDQDQLIIEFLDLLDVIKKAGI